MDGGTLYQLRNLVNRRNVVSSPFDAFLELVTTAHILAAATKVFGMDSLSEPPYPSLFPPGVTANNIRRALLNSVMTSEFVDLSYPMKSLYYHVLE